MRARLCVKREEQQNQEKGNRIAPLTQGGWQSELLAAVLLDASFAALRIGTQPRYNKRNEEEPNNQATSQPNTKHSRRGLEGEGGGRAKHEVTRARQAITNPGNQPIASHLAPHSRSPNFAVLFSSPVP